MGRRASGWRAGILPDSAGRIEGTMPPTVFTRGAFAHQTKTPPRYTNRQKFIIQQLFQPAILLFI
jgi:hypothetical protein